VLRPGRIVELSPIAFTSREVGKVATNYHAVSLKLKTVVMDMDEEVEGEEPHREEQDSAMPSLATTAATSLPPWAKVTSAKKLRGYR